jgi:hypothetical protein
MAVHEGFARLGFKAEEVFIHRNPDNEMMVILQTQGKEFAVSVGKIGGTDESWADGWSDLVMAVRDGTVSDEMLRGWYESGVAYRHSFQFLAGILKKGIILPCSKDVAAKLLN